MVPLTDVKGLLYDEEKAPMVVEVMLHGGSMELTFQTAAAETWGVMEGCRRATSSQVRSEKAHEHHDHEAMKIDDKVASVFNAMHASTSGGGRASVADAAVSLKLTDEDWALFLKNAKQM